MRQILVLVFLAVVLLALPQIEVISEVAHPAYYVIVIFFTALSYTLFRLDGLIPTSLKPQATLIKTGVRFLACLIFVGIAIYQYEDPYMLVVQFILIYLIYLIFEIVTALTNLRRN